MDDATFFHQATILICRHLDIEVSLFSLINYIKDFLPADRLFLDYFMEDFSAIQTIATASQEGGRRMNRLTYIDEKARQYMKWAENYLKDLGKPETEIINRPDNHDVSRVMVKDFQTPDTSLLSLSLLIDSKWIGNLIIEANGTDRFKKSDADLVRLLNEPLSIAMANTLKHDEIIKIKDQLISDNQFLRGELLRETGTQIIGQEFGLKKVVQKARQVAPIDSPVLLTGETGTGKELIAKLIHQQSARKSHSLVTVNCGAIPESLLDSELFGHEKGAFTGALEARQGHFERANNGTVFLDEVGELPLQAQVRLLRVIQNGEIQRVGGTETLRVNIRIVAATHRDLEEMVNQGTFREDLWFRLNVFPIHLPPLRQRKNDIPALVQHFIETKSKKLNKKQIPSFMKGSMDRLIAYDWPGNVRELENILERALILSDGDTIDVAVLIQQSSARPRDFVGSPDDAIAPLEEVVKAHLEKALNRAGGRIFGPGGAAALTGLNPNTFRSKMRKLGIRK